MVAADRTIPPPENLFDTFVELRFDLRALAASLAVPPSILLDWLNTPEFQDRLAAWSRLESLAAELRAASLKNSALATLEQTLLESHDPVERRRAASVILRAASPKPPPRGRGLGVGSSPSSLKAEGLGVGSSLSSLEAEGLPVGSSLSSLEAEGLPVGSSLPSPSLEDETARRLTSISTPPAPPATVTPDLAAVTDRANSLLEQICSSLCIDPTELVSNDTS